MVTKKIVLRACFKQTLAHISTSTFVGISRWATFQDLLYSPRHLLTAGSQSPLPRKFRKKSEKVLPALLQKLVGELFFFDFSQGNLENLVGIWREFCGIFLTHREKAQKFRGKFRSVFRNKIRSSKKSFVQNSLCRRATLRKGVPRASPHQGQRRLDRE